MAVRDRLRSLFGWPSSGTPTDRKSKGAQEGDQFGSNPYQLYANTVKPPYERRRKYDIYDEMDELPIVSTILDAYAEDGSQIDREQKSAIWIETKDGKTKKVLDDLKKRLRWDDFIEPIVRDTGKYGDDLASLEIDDKIGIVGWDWKDPRDIERIETRIGVLAGFEKTSLLKKVVAAMQRKEKVKYTWQPWEMVHFRFYRRKREWKQKFRNIYGTSLLAGSERVAKQVKILDDLMMVRRLTKTLDYRVYEIDTGRTSVEEETLILKRWRNALKRRPFIDPAGGRLDQIFDPSTFQEDIFWAKHRDSTSGVQVIPGQPNVTDTVDIDQFRNQLFGSLRAPKAYFGEEGDINAKATLSAQDMKWGRAVNALQRAVKNGFHRLCQIELALHNMDANVDFTVRMVVPSVLEDLSRLEAVQTLIDVAERMAQLGETMQMDPAEWRQHILTTVLGLSKQEIDRFTSDEPDPDDLDPKTPRPGADPDGNGDGGDSDDPEDEKKKLDEAIRRVLTSKIGGTTTERPITDYARPSELPNFKGERSSSFHPVPELDGDKHVLTD